MISNEIYFFALLRSSNFKTGKIINISTKMKNKSNISKLAFKLVEVEFEKLLSVKDSGISETFIRKGI